MSIHFRAIFRNNPPTDHARELWSQPHRRLEIRRAQSHCVSRAEHSNAIELLLVACFREISSGSSTRNEFISQLPAHVSVSCERGVVVESMRYTVPFPHRFPDERGIFLGTL